MSTEIRANFTEPKSKPVFTLLVNEDFRELDGFAAVKMENSATKFAISLKIEHEKRGRDRSKGIVIETIPEEAVVSAAIEILFRMGYYANITAASVNGTDGYAWLTRRESDFESW